MGKAAPKKPAGLRRFWLFILSQIFFALTGFSQTADEILDGTNLKGAKPGWGGIAFYLLEFTVLLAVVWFVLTNVSLILASVNWSAFTVQGFRQAKKSQIVLGVGLLFLVLNGLFPPYIPGAWSILSDSPKPQGGYHFLFFTSNDQKINFTRFCVQFLTIIAITSVAFVLCWREEKKIAANEVAKKAMSELANSFPSETKFVHPPQNIINN